VVEGTEPPTICAVAAISSDGQMVQVKRECGSRHGSRWKWLEHVGGRRNSLYAVESAWVEVIFLRFCGVPHRIPLITRQEPGTPVGANCQGQRNRPSILMQRVVPICVIVFSSFFPSIFA
jgi:hypothetical protein